MYTIDGPLYTVHRHKPKNETKKQEEKTRQKGKKKQVGKRGNRVRKVERVLITIATLFFNSDNKSNH